MRSEMPGPFVCEPCGYTTQHIGHWRAHLRTKRHELGGKAGSSGCGKYSCEHCGRVYKHRQSLHKHQKTCTPTEDKCPPCPPEESQVNNSSAELLKVIEQLIPRVNQTTNNISVQILLNKECADAMTIQSFATNLQMSLEDICKQKTDGRPATVSRIVSENLGPLRVQDRPIHCTDEGRSKWLVHDERGGWREDTGKAVMNAASFGITRRFQSLWDKAHPNWREDDQLRTSWIDLVACLHADPSDQEVGATLERLAPQCRLSAEQLRTALLIDQ